MRRGALCAALATAIATLAMVSAAEAYPQWQLSTGAVRCNQCHYAPAGGGLITGYGRDAAGDELATFAGEGAFLHGAVTLPAWLALGADFRGAYVGRDVGDINGSTNAVFPMQADLVARVAAPEGFSVYATAGVRGQVRSNAEDVPLQNYQPIDQSRFISREHWVMWQPQPQGAYARLGRFYAPFGLRLAEHITFIRRDVGFNQLQESYNLSGGWVTDPWEVHVTAFAPDFLRHIGSDEKGLASYGERRLLDGTAAVGVQGRWSSAVSGPTRLTGGVVGKLFVAPARTMVFLEGNLVRLVLDGARDRTQYIGAVGATVFPYRGVTLTALAERNQEDVKVRDARWDAGTLLLGWFPYPHFELQLMARWEHPGGGDTTDTIFFQLHYYL